MSSAHSASPILLAEGIGKSYRGVAALRDVSIALWPGQVHAVIGEAGAGKTTLAKILSGELEADAGRILVDGREGAFSKLADARHLGIVATSEERNLMMDLSVTQNVLVHGPPCHPIPLLRWVDWGQGAKATASILDFIGVNINPRKKVASLSRAEQQFVEIAKALVQHPRIVILDEPVARLNEQERERVFDVIRKLSAQGVALLYASQQLEDLARIVAHQVTVLKSGRALGTLPASEVSARAIMEMMVAEATQAAALREADRLRYEFVSLVSHELRTPLAAIKGHATTLLRRSWPEDIQRECLATIDEECDRLKELIDNVLDVAKIEQGVLRIEKEPVVLATVARRVIDQIGGHDSRHRLVADFPSDLPLVHADPRRIKQILENLLGNAIKYSPGGGTIVVMARRRTDAVEALVKDEGVGIAPEHLQRVFERFYRVPNPAIGNVGGSGLGLAICRGIIEAHGGSIWAESTVGQGSTFGFSLPVFTPSNQAVTGDSNADGLDVGG